MTVPVQFALIGGVILVGFLANLLFRLTRIPSVLLLIVAVVLDRRDVRTFSPAEDFADEPTPATFTDWMARFFGLRLADRETEFIEMIRASYLSDTLFWVQASLGAAICALDLILDQTVIIAGAALIVPVARLCLGSEGARRGLGGSPHGVRWWVFRHPARGRRAETPLMLPIGMRSRSNASC